MGTINENLAVDRQDPHCPVCHVPVRLTQTKAEDGRAQYCLSCATHGRLTLNFVLAADAVSAPYITPAQKERSKHQLPVEPMAKGA